MNRRARAAAAVLAVAGSSLLLLGCASGGDGVAGAWGEDAKGEPRLVLADDGALTGTDGCNRLHGEWEEEGGTVRFGNVLSTAMACPDVDIWLVGLSTAKLDGDQLRIFDESGTEVGTLQRGSTWG